MTKTLGGGDNKATESNVESTMKMSKGKQQLFGLAMMAGALGDGLGNEHANEVARALQHPRCKTQLTKKQSKARKKSKAAKKARRG